MWRNALVGGACIGFVLGAYGYSMRSVRQTGISSQEVEEFRARKERELK